VLTHKKLFTASVHDVARGTAESSTSTPRIPFEAGVSMEALMPREQHIERPHFHRRRDQLQVQGLGQERGQPAGDRGDEIGFGDNGSSAEEAVHTQCNRGPYSGAGEHFSPPLRRAWYQVGWPPTCGCRLSCSVRGVPRSTGCPIRATYR
jgi:hypothetical protein